MPCECWEQSSGPLQGHQVLWTSEPSFQPLMEQFLTKMQHNASTQAYRVKLAGMHLWAIHSPGCVTPQKSTWMQCSIGHHRSFTLRDCLTLAKTSQSWMLSLSFPILTFILLLSSHVAHTNSEPKWILCSFQASSAHNTEGVTKHSSPQELTWLSFLVSDPQDWQVSKEKLIKPYKRIYCKKKKNKYMYFHHI